MNAGYPPIMDPPKDKNKEVATSFSYSGIKLFQQCPKKYYHLKIAKDFKNEGTTATNYGTDVHKAAEDFIGEGIAIPEKYAYMKPIMKALNDIPGKKFVEMGLGLKRNEGKYTPCNFTSKDFWYRGIADLVIIDDELAWLVDYKTSKNAKYADTNQLDLLAGALFIHFPRVREVRAALAFVVSGEFISKNYYFENTQKYIETMQPELNRLETAMATEVWNPISGPLCKFCPVKTCAHNRG